MRGIWIDHGNDADYARLKAEGITDPYYDVRDPRISLSYLNDVRKRGFNPGLYLCSQGEGWPSSSKLTGREWADWAYQQVQLRIAPETSGSFPKVCLNCETHNADWIVQMLKRWRARSPKRETYWALEGHQAGLFSPAHVAAINLTNVIVVPEFFHGDMKPQAPGVVLELLQAGFEPRRITGFYDAAALPYNWSGLAFTQGRL